jgi:hypothetical protein
MKNSYEFKDLLKLRLGNGVWFIDVLEGKDVHQTKLTIEVNYESTVYVLQNDVFQWVATYKFSEESDCRLDEVMSKVIDKELTGLNKVRSMQIARSGDY